MKKEEIIKAWKNPDYRNQLGKEIEEIPNHPSGWGNLSDLQLGEVFGGFEELADATWGGFTFGCCTFWRECDGFNTNQLRTYGCCP